MRGTPPGDQRGHAQVVALDAPGGATRWLWAAGAALGISSATAALLGALSGLIVYRAARHHGVWGSGDPPDGLAEDVEFPAHDAIPIRGWLLHNGAGAPAPTVVLCHGAWTGRRECLPLALRLHGAGFNVLLFDFRAHGHSGGRYITVGHQEAHDVLGAVRFLSGRPEVDRERIGVVGFSMGAVAAIRAAAECPRIRAVVADSGYASFVDAVRYSFRQIAHFPHYPFGPLALQWARWLVRVDPDKLRPVDVVGRIAPRPLLIIHGEDDEIVPVRHAHLLFQAAEEPKELWVAAGAHHVGARDLYPEEYFTRIEAFLQQALDPTVRFGSPPSLAA